MHGIGGPLPAPSVVRVQVTLRVATIARLDLQIVVVVDMAIAAGRHLTRRDQLMRICQWETSRGMVKIRRQPRNSIVAVGASRNREHRGCCRMVRVRGLLPGREMAARVSAIRRRNLQIVVVADMAARARNIGVPIGQRKANRRGGMVDSDSEPTVEGMAGVASLRELRGDVVWHVPAHGLGLLIILQVTRNASRRQSLELADRRTLVAVVALHRGVGS